MGKIEHRNRISQHSFKGSREISKQSLRTTGVDDVLVPKPSLASRISSTKDALLLVGDTTPNISTHSFNSLMRTTARSRNRKAEADSSHRESRRSLLERLNIPLVDRIQPVSHPSPSCFQQADKEICDTTNAIQGSHVKVTQDHRIEADRLDDLHIGAHHLDDLRIEDIAMPAPHVDPFTTSSTPTPQTQKASQHQFQQRL
ncbi:hypothetical protein B0H13DRAFT_1924189 [Mycena leptocephala]|nr:hypothetical protein B0H13DRAFT_1924189 [Mycena leptocephala]